ncbi:hypothetical protein AMS68_002385 [Peltaster fructicola]|uniref:Peroxidase n=1 Tax=Peltaster fructicola TaxID=286661 RepID=A0A6H0XQF2_9PEZI|nr:hypothetical protein AMS68_002385 [Peltaster fructicola]
MAAASRTFSRFTRSSTLSGFATSTTRQATVARQTFQRQARRGYADAAPKSGGGSNALLGAAVVAALGAGGYYYLNSTASGQSAKSEIANKTAGAAFTPSRVDYQKVYDAVAKRLIDEDDYDDGSYGPVLLRLGWHASGTFDKETGTGGSNGATMRFAPEGDHGANAGLKAARDFLEPVKEQFPWISYSDLWTLAAVCAIQEMNGPHIPWRPGRADRDLSFCTPDGRLPDASKEQKHLRDIFYRMGFNDQEIVALSGAHALGRCHTDRSGFDGPWTFSPTQLTNDYYKLLIEEKWSWKKWQGPKQYEDVKSKSLMMLPSDMALIKDKSFREHVKRYADNNDAFFSDFSNVIMKLFELGVPFTTGEDARIEFQKSA